MGKDFSMELPPGSLVFSVQGTLFRVCSEVIVTRSSRIHDTIVFNL